MGRARTTRGVRNARQAILWPLKMCMIMAVDESERSLLLSNCDVLSHKTKDEKLMMSAII